MKEFPNIKKGLLLSIFFVFAFNSYSFPKWSSKGDLVNSLEKINSLEKDNCLEKKNHSDKANNSDKDTIYPLESVVIVESSKENRLLRNQPLSVSIVDKSGLEQNGVYSLKGLTSIIPNFYAPNYGSKITSSIYVRGIGSRINSSAVGLYVDGVPYYNKNSFDFDYSDVDRVDVLRGPQGTLYGLGTMGGLVSVHTKNPFSYQGINIKLSVATKNHYRGSLTKYHRVSSKFAFSIGGFLNSLSGFYKNQYTGKLIDNEVGGGGRIHAILRPSASWEFDLNLSYEYCDAGGFPYGEYNIGTGEVASPNYNYESGYFRSLFNAALTSKYSKNNFTLTSVTGFQNLKDRMKMDQDYSIANLYTLIQNQYENTLSEEIAAKGFVDANSALLGRWDYTFGISGFVEHLNVDAPMSFESDFIDQLQRTMDAAMVHSPVKVRLTDERMAIPGMYKTPTLGGAIFHQSVLNDLFSLKGLSLTLGLRWDYQRVKIDYNTNASLAYQTYRNNIPIGEGEYFVEYIGNQKHSYTTLLPRFALKYEFKGAKSNGNIYAISSRGYRGGGYNIQMFGDYMSDDVQKNKGLIENDETINNAISYKPEYLWNYEAGAHLNLFENRLALDASLFFMQIKDQQVVRFAEGGLGRYTSNAGRAKSRGFEVAARFFPMEHLELNGSYGYTDAKFTENSTQIKVGGVLTPVDYKGKNVPFAPKNSLNIGAAYTLNITDLHSLKFYLNYNGLGKIYFTEDNSAYQSYYSTFNGRVALNLALEKNSFRRMELALWTTNIFNKKYKIFYFENLSKSYAQQSRGIQAGIDLIFKF